MIILLALSCACLIFISLLFVSFYYDMNLFIDALVEALTDYLDALRDSEGDHNAR